MFKYFYIVALFLILFSCEKHSTKSELFLQIKKLEYDRITNLDKWNNIRKDKNFKAIKYSYVNSLSKLKDIKLLPVLKELLNSSTDDSLTSECIFAIGQTGSALSEQILLDLPFKSYSFKNQVNILSALSHCASQKSIDFFEEHLNDPKIVSSILVNTAISSRKNIDATKIKILVADSAAVLKPTLSLSYLLYYTGNIGDLSKIIQIAQNSNGLIQKYALKKMKKLSLDHKSQFYSSLKNDSISFKAYKNVLILALKKSAPWENQYYAIPLASIIKDSTLTDRIYSLRQSENIYVSLTALDYLPETDPELALTALLEKFGKESNLYIRGKIIKILAEHYPDKAYSFVMQNLDKGNSMFKSQLLDALADINSKMAIQTLLQFINVDDPILICNAFENLRRLGYINNNIINTLLESDTFYCVATALDFLNEKNKDFDVEKLKTMYKKFNQPLEFEVQFSIINLLKSRTTLSSIIPIDTLLQFACHEVVRQKIYQDFPNRISKIENEYTMSYEHPAYLEPDSVIYFSKKPKFEINTDRGKIIIELFPAYASYTVNSFIKLVSKSFYDGLIFHRVVPDFVIQGGDPTGTGWGGPNFLIPSEDNELPFKTGSIGIATSGFDTGSSQFFICQSEQPHLNGNYTLFGQVIDGMDIVNSIIPGDKIITIKSTE